MESFRLGSIYSIFVQAYGFLNLEITHSSNTQVALLQNVFLVSIVLNVVIFFHKGRAS